MIDRCTNPKHVGYANYGAKGITVCERWRVFENFVADMGQRPSRGHTIDRIDGTGIYERGNCRWATSLEQGANLRTNRRLLLRGEILHLAEVARRLGVATATIRARVRYHGETHQQAVDYYATVGRTRHRCTA